VDLSTAILELSENGDLQRIHEKWLNDRITESQTKELDSDSLQVYSFSGLFLICGVACLATLAIHVGVLVHKYWEHAASSQQAVVSSTDGSSRSSSSSSRSRLRAFLSFADRRETDTPRASKHKAAALAGVGGDSIGGVSAASSTTSVSTTTSC
jgi:hypothetical protein